VGWAKTLGTKEVQNVASYVLSLQGTKPAGGKPAEGEKWVEEAVKAEAVATTDTTKVAVK
ncbi:MAG: hypothetical protein RL705_1265, partial [Bacteroidota bacterium]|jgi:cytochrome c oxidase cbb3-type subunit 3